MGGEIASEGEADCELRAREARCAGATPSIPSAQFIPEVEHSPSSSMRNKAVRCLRPVLMLRGPIAA